MEHTRLPWTNGCAFAGRSARVSATWARLSVLLPGLCPARGSGGLCHSFACSPDGVRGVTWPRALGPGPLLSSEMLTLRLHCGEWQQSILFFFFFVNRRYFSEQFWVHSKVEQKVRRFPMCTPPPHRPRLPQYRPPSPQPYLWCAS